ncbi:MAG: HYR domain-containing protein, partial [Dokdonia sp.]
TDPADTGSATAVDNCDGMPVITFVDAVVAGTGNNSVITRTWTATDANGNASNCDQIITVVDTTAPVITCPADTTVECDASTDPADTGSATAVDNCDGMPVITFVDAVVAGTGNNSVITRTWTATDANGNASNCDQIITVVDTTAPDAMCVAPFTIELDAMGMASITAADIDNGSSDNCGTVTTSIDVSTFTCADVGTPVTVTLTVIDENMNSSTCTTVVTVEDNIPVTILSGPADIFTGTGVNNGDCMTVVDYGPITIDDFVLDDNCDDASVLTIALTGGLGSGASFPVGVTTEEYTITDGNGNQTSYTFTVTIVDTTDPVIDCPDDLIVSDGGTGAYTIEDYTGLAFDNCTSDTDLIVTQDPVAGTVVPALSTTMVTLTATDEAGNTTTCTFEILVDETLSVEENALEVRDVKLFPNPTSGIIKLETTNVIIEKVEVYDIRGRLVQSFELNIENPTIDLTDLQVATYIVRIQTERGTLTKRIIKN